MSKTESELTPESSASSEEILEQGNLSDEERIVRIRKILKTWQLGAVICFLLCFVLLGVAIVKFVSGAAVDGEELISLDMLPDNRINTLISSAKKARKDARKIEKKLETILVSEDVTAVLADAPKTMQSIIDSENHFLESIVEYGRAMDTMTVLVGGAREWNYGFQESLEGFEGRTRSRIDKLQDMITKFP